MSYTLLRLMPHGILLCDYHLRRLALDSTACVAFSRFAREAEPGVWAAWADEEGALHTERRPESTLQDDLPTRRLPSPLIGRRGPIPKPASPGPYDDVRRMDMVTLLTSADGEEFYEACRAALLAWDGKRILCAPDDRPRVWSTSEAAVREKLGARAIALRKTDEFPLLLVNAVKGTCSLRLPGRAEFPVEVRDEIDAILAASTRWPAG